MEGVGIEYEDDMREWSVVVRKRERREIGVEIVAGRLS